MKTDCHWNRTFQALAAIVALLVSVSAVFAYPKPHQVPLRWELDFEPGELRLYVDRDAQPGDPVAYWYFTYKVVNNTGQERWWAPQFTLYTDQGEILNSGESVPPQIEQELITLVGNDLLERQNQAIGKIFTGERNAIEGLVAWPADNLNITELSLFVSGISGESAQVENPMTGEKETLVKTLERSYQVPGNPVARRDEPATLVEQRWVMR